MSSISFFHTGFVICLAGTILFFAITIVLFFVFDIRTIFLIRSGRAQAKTVKEMETVNSSTGRLRTSKKSHSSSQRKMNNQPERGISAAQAPVIQPPVKESTVSQVPNDYPDDFQNITEKLSPDMQENDYENTVLLSKADETDELETSGETVVLSKETAQQAKQSTGPVHFEIVKKIICLDTDEVID